MNTVRLKHDTHPALSYRCPFCGADTGELCRTKNGRTADWPHSRRTALTKPPEPLKQALCCECGQLRTLTLKHFWRARGYYAAAKDEWKRRMVGQLKCSHCQAITTHALLEDPAYPRDLDEDRQLVALGADVPRGLIWDAATLRREYREAGPRNPYLKHRYWVSEAREAWQAGRREVVNLCGETTPLKRDPDGPSVGRTPNLDLIAPEQARDQEYEDHDTGLWWVEMDCVDCLRVSNAYQLERRRKLVVTRLRDLAQRAGSGELSIAETDRLIEFTDSLIAVERGRT
jgi:hypothetical protein